MGRRIISSKKHKKIKFVDPYYSGPPRNNKKKLQNEPPTEPEDQEVPFEMQRMINVKNKLKDNKFKRKKKKKPKIKDDFIIVRRDKTEERLPGMTRPLKPQDEEVRQQPGETESRFFNRLQRMANAAIAEARVEQKYDIELVNIDEEGMAHYSAGEKRSGTKKKEKRKKYQENKKQKKKEKLLDHQESKVVTQDVIKFGEVVMEPPAFDSKPKNAPSSKVGKRDLMLKKFLVETSETETAKQSIKRKNMPEDRRKTLEMEQSRVVELYRSLKKKKNVDF